MRLTLASAVAQTQQSGPGWIIDPAAQCGTSNPFATGRETISWSGSCLRGRLHGAGVLIWFEDGVETERDEGTFRNGELDGPSVIALAGRTTIFGNYRDGVRHGEFMIVQTNGSYIQSIYANGTLIGQKSLDRAEISAWRDARKGDQRLTQLSVDRTQQAPIASAQRQQVASAPTAPAPAVPLAAPQPVTPAPAAALPPPTLSSPAASTPTEAPSATTTAAAPPPVAPVSVPVLVPTPAQTPPPAIASAPVATQTTTTNAPTPIISVPQRPVQPIIAAAPAAPAKAQLVATRPPPLMQYIRFRASYRANPTAAAGTAIAGLRPPPGAASGDGQRIVLTPPPGARPSTPSDDLNRDQPRLTQLRLRAPPRNPQPTQLVRRGQSNLPRIRLRPPPSIAASQSASSQTAPVAPPAVARPAAGAAKANAGERLALNLASADLRDATGLILGDVLKVQYTVDPEVRGTVNAAANPSLTREELVPWLRGALQANGADLVITPAGYRVYSLQRASTGTGALPSLAPPQQAESIFVQGYAAERAGRDREAAQLYAQLVNAYPTTGIVAMARERQATLQRRANAPSRATTLPSEVSMAGAYLCTRRGLYPNESK